LEENNIGKKLEVKKVENKEIVEDPEGSFSTKKHSGEVVD
jgi:hypothetical protein